jgi:hypothetical protein
MEVDQACRLEDAVACGDVMEDQEDLVLGQVDAVKRSALAFGAAGSAGAAVEQTKRLETPRTFRRYLTFFDLPRSQGEIRGPLLCWK